MPSSASAAPSQAAIHVDEDCNESSSYGQVQEYIRDRLFLASYTHPPTAQTPFPYPTRQPKTPSKRSSKHAPSSSGLAHPQPVYFSVDRYLLYNAFHADFGPLHIGHLYRFAVQIHEVLGDPENEGRPVVFWSNADPKSRANAACILACYMVLIQSWPPHLALAPIAQIDPPLMPFRDAGYSQADYILNVQDVVYGVWKAKEEGLCSLKDFSLEEYEKYERVDMGDFNWISPNFVAFASPQHKPIDVIPQGTPEYAALPRSTAQIFDSDLPSPFKNVLAHFKARKVGLVVRLNSELYSPSYFTAVGISHLDMIFDDGTCPPLQLVRKFIRLAHDVIVNKGRNIAVHCKAGLGRTGCLIGAYLIYRYGFTANEVIAYMRFMRPGMVVGPQQHWLHLNQGAFREWWFEDNMREKLALLRQSTPPRNKSRLDAVGGSYTPPNGSAKRRALGELDCNDQNGGNVVAVHDENLPAPTPGQPRKTSKLYGGEKHTTMIDEEPAATRAAAERRSKSNEASENEDDVQTRMLSASTRKSLSPSGKRAVSCMTTTTTTTTEWLYEDDQENAGNGVPTAKTPSANRSVSGIAPLSVSKRNSPTRRATESRAHAAGVRKTSGRVGSVGSVSQATKIKQ